MRNYEEMKLDTDVLGHIRKLNAEGEARVGDEGFFMGWEEEFATHFSTVYDFEMERALDMYSDIYKEEYYVRPYLSPNWTLADIQQRIEWLYEDIRGPVEEEPEPWEEWIDYEDTLR